VTRKIFPIAAIALVGVAAFVSDKLSAASVTSPCLTSGVGASYVVKALESTMWTIDSSYATTNGFPYKASNFAILADSASCAQVIASFNALYSPEDSLKHLSAAYIAKAWPPNAYALYLPAESPYLGELFLFDSAFTYRDRATVPR